MSKRTDPGRPHAAIIASPTDGRMSRWREMALELLKKLHGFEN